MTVHLKGNQRVVFCGNNQRGNSDLVQKAAGALGLVIVRRSAEPEERSREAIIKLPDGGNRIEPIGAVELWREGAFSPDALAKPLQEALGVELIRKSVESPN